MKNWLLLNNISNINRKAFLTVCLAVVFSWAFAQQNLMENYSFEQHDTCPNNYGQIYYSKHWFQPIGDPVGQSSTDYFSTCATNTIVSVPSNVLGYQMPRTGIAYGGFLISGPGSTLNGREMIEGKLTDTLKSNTKYCIGVYMNLANQSTYATDILNYRFTPDSFKLEIMDMVNGNFPTNFDSLYLSTDHSDTVSWYLSEDVYLANGTENYLTFGNFNVETLINYYPANSSGNFPYPYYHIDDVFVYEITDANAGNDTLINTAGIVQLGQNNDPTAFYEWWPHTGIVDTNALNPQAFVTQTTTYYVKKTQCGEVSYDTVVVTVSPVGLKDFTFTKEDFNLFPNPASESVTVSYAGNGMELRICDLLGKEVKRSSLNAGKTEIDLSGLTNGVYFISVMENDKPLVTKKFVVQH
jgi:hypothetical protein